MGSRKKWRNNLCNSYWSPFLLSQDRKLSYLLTELWIAALISSAFTSKSKKKKLHAVRKCRKMWGYKTDVIFLLYQIDLKIFRANLIIVDDKTEGVDMLLSLRFSHFYWQISKILVQNRQNTSSQKKGSIWSILTYLNGVLFSYWSSQIKCNDVPTFKFNWANVSVD